MTPKEYFTQAQIHSRQFKYHLTRMKQFCGRGGHGDSRLWDLHKSMKKDFEALVSRQQKMAELIARLPDANQRNVLTLRYLCGMRWEQIAGRMHYSSRHLHRLHQQALEALAPDAVGAGDIPAKKRGGSL